MTTDSILRNATEDELGCAVEENVVAMFRSMVQALNGEIEETAKVGRYHTAPVSPIFKGVFHADLASEEADSTIEETIEWFKARHAPFFFWWTGQDTQPGDLGQRLTAHGFALFEKDAPARQPISTNYAFFPSISNPGMRAALSSQRNPASSK